MLNLIIEAAGLEEKCLKRTGSRLKGVLPKETREPDLSLEDVATSQNRISLDEFPGD